MDSGVRERMLGMVEAHFKDEALKRLLTDCIRDKAEETSRWSAITINAHRMLGGNSADLERAAALTELLILALDIVDDLQDQDNATKRWMQWPAAYTLNAVLGMFAAFMAEWEGVGQAGLLSEVGKLLARSVEGQQRDVGDAVLTEADYVAMVRKKSGSLIRLACRIGAALVPDLNRETLARLDDMAECIGMVAQIGNDVKDVLRYDLKNDLLQKKRTLPILFMLVDSESEFPPLGQFYAGDMPVEEFLSLKTACMQYIRDSGCIEYARVIQRLYIDKAKELLETLPTVSPWKEKFQACTIGVG